MNEKPLSSREAIEAIKVLTEAIKVQQQIWFKDEDLIEKASEKIKELIGHITANAN